MAPNIVCCIYIYLISHLNNIRIVAITPRLELKRRIRKSPHDACFATTTRKPNLARDAGTRAEFRMRGPERQTRDIIATMFRSLALPVDGDEWELGESGQ